MSALIKTDPQRSLTDRRLVRFGLQQISIRASLLLCGFLFFLDPATHHGEALAQESGPAAVCRQNISNTSSAHNDIYRDLLNVINPYNSTCYDWRGRTIPCDFQGAYAELILGKTSPKPRFRDNRDGTVTDRLTGLIWLRSAGCLGSYDWKSAFSAARQFRERACAGAGDSSLADGSVAGDWRLPTMDELCTLIDYGNRDPALPDGHPFLHIPSGFVWTSTTLDTCDNLVWVVYLQSGGTCYNEITNRAGHLLPVKSSGSKQHYTENRR
jgi:Protein of unknown function (DUF1566)